MGWPTIGWTAAETPGRTDQAAAQAELADAVTFARKYLGFEPEEEQKQVLAGGRRGILNCPRQWGKSTVMSIVTVHRGLTRPGSLILVISPSLRQSGELIRKAEACVRKLGLTVRRDGVNRLSLVFENGSRIVGLPANEKTLVGFSNVSLLLVDEAARVPDELYYRMRPVLAMSNGDLWLLSTPVGRRGFFFREWTEGGPEWLRVSKPATECARYDRGFLEEERKRGEQRFRQDYLCEFVDTEGKLFPQELIDAAWDDFPALG